MQFTEIKDTYQQLWRTVKITDLSATDAVVSRIIPNRGRYEQAQRESGVWWPVIAAIHSLEASLSFKGHLHNGDRLSARTRNVPDGRPISGSPSFTWEESAADALAMKRTDEVNFLDTPEEILWYCERYNGWGYQTGAGRNSTPPRRSPYLWSKTNHWTKGKFTADGRFDPNAGSSQVGVAAILKRIEHLGHISFDPVQPAVPPLTNGQRPILRFGDKGFWVGVAQHTVNGCGFEPLTVNNDFDSATERIIMKFQRSVGLNDDGDVGPLTWAALDAHKKLPGWTPLSGSSQPASTTPVAAAPIL
ncbi:peptidoglycan-binding protein [Coleofasciculus sp. FACHB-129]|uniref:peptidoglycan-binding protein n=1 Tax=Cyanophyceae TaxID=3028117 RepID=UPI0016822ACF|nr:peptidoglycan-binding protein [Coleofasciculus sp. FACHB-129]MBD1896781.1 peptidoglycan-binding protein [Coleofasciculus sp. FACHB-129]